MKKFDTKVLIQLGERGGYILFPKDPWEKKITTKNSKFGYKTEICNKEKPGYRLDCEEIAKVIKPIYAITRTGKTFVALCNKEVLVEVLKHTKSCFLLWEDDLTTF